MLYAQYLLSGAITLQWRHNGRHNVSNHQPHDCLLNRLFRSRSKKTSKLRLTGLCAGNSPGTGEFPAQMASNAEDVSIWWRHHEKPEMFCKWSLDCHGPRHVRYELKQGIKRTVLGWRSVFEQSCCKWYSIIAVYFTCSRVGGVNVYCFTLWGKHFWNLISIELSSCDYEKIANMECNSGLFNHNQSNEMSYNEILYLIYVSCFIYNTTSWTEYRRWLLAHIVRHIGIVSRIVIMK